MTRFLGSCEGCWEGTTQDLLHELKNAQSKVGICLDADRYYASAKALSNELRRQSDVMRLTDIT
jgi:hypothetical protein